MLTLTAVVVTARPVVGIYLIGFLTLFTDGTVSPWYPFLKNMSSWESILYLEQRMFISPFEVFLAIAVVVAWLLRLLIDGPSRPFIQGRLLWPLVAFGGFSCWGLRGGRRHRR